MSLLQLEELEQSSILFRGRAGNVLARGLMHLFAVDRVNELYDRNSHLSGPDFASAVLKDIGLECSVGFSESSGMGCDPFDDIRDVIPEGPFITISNHPCGHIDGVALVALFGHLRPDYKVMANQILSRIHALETSFITVVPTGSHRTSPGAANISGVKAALAHLRGGAPLGLFPAGAVSDLSLRDRCIRDREWQASVIKLIMKAKVPVLPVRFFDRNSSFYYSLGLIHWKIRLLRLPSEVFNKRGSSFRIGIGPLISVQELEEFGHDVAALRDFLRSSVYDMV